MNNKVIDFPRPRPRRVVEDFSSGWKAFVAANRYDPKNDINATIFNKPIPFTFYVGYREFQTTITLQITNPISKEEIMEKLTPALERIKRTEFPNSTIDIDDFMLAERGGRVIFNINSACISEFLQPGP